MIIIDESDSVLTSEWVNPRFFPFFKWWDDISFAYTRNAQTRQLNWFHAIHIHDYGSATNVQFSVSINIVVGEFIRMRSANQSFN